MGKLNKCQFIGRLGADPEIKTVGENKVAEFSLAVTENYKTSDNKKIEKTTWVRISAWGGLAKICEKYVRKSMLLYVECRLENKTWVDKTTGEKRYKDQMVCKDLQMLSKKSDFENKQQSYIPYEQQPPIDIYEDDF